MDYAARLDRIDWDFPQAGTGLGSIHKAHWFAGNFIPQIPAALIELLSEPDDVVLDPFGGSGTTALEAARLGRRAIYSDLVSACHFIATAKLAAATAGLSAETRAALMLALTWDHACFTDQVGDAKEGSHPELARWYHSRTLGQLRFIWKQIERVDGAERLTLELAFSDLLFSCVSTGGARTSTGGTRRHHWGWVADNVVPKDLVQHDAIDGFRTRIHALPAPFQPKHKPVVLQSDARSLPLEEASVDVIVTSPPYVGVIDYVKANRMLYLWMNWPFDGERAREIGARYKRQRTSLPAEYLDAMEAAWREFNRVLRPGGRIAVVIGESRAFPGVSARAIEELAARMPITWGPRERVPSRRRVSDRAAREAREVIVVAEKR